MRARISELAWRNLVHDKVRLFVTVTGVVFAVVLIVVELGLFLGFTTTTSSLIDRSEADIWMTAARVPYIEAGVGFSERKLSTVLATPGVARAAKYIARFSQWQRHDGRQESVQVVGFEPGRGLGGPWNVVEGNVDDLRQPDNVFIDEVYKDALGVTRVGEIFEMHGHRARIAGFTRGIRAFTTSPYVFTSFKSAQDFASVPEDQTVYILVKVAAGERVDAVRQRLAARVKDVDVLTRAAFSSKTRFYWMFTTGAGVAVLLAALLGLVVGFVVVAQTIYATTMDHLREYGTLKAMGATNGYLYRVIIEQAVISAIVGYTLAMFVSAFIVNSSAKGGAAILLPWQMAAGVLGLTILMCAGAAIVSINKVMRLDPATVFKG
ncbi:MAG TPA: ABC transporter permease [Vicinamibacterales bacterium]|nr:ABC transporter permease [Vicinamibacterales bacterium]